LFLLSRFLIWHIDDVLSINNSRFAEFLPLIYPPELEVEETTDTASSASFLDLYLEFDDSGQLSTKIYDKRDDFNCTRLAATCDKIYQLLAHGRWFSPGTPASSTTKTGCHDIAEILLKVALKHQKSNIN
jgi:hypothetical protein